MSKQAFFDRVEPTEHALRIAAGREAMTEALAAPIDDGEVRNDVHWTGAFATLSSGVAYDRFTVTFNGADEVTDAVDGHLRALGATVVQRSGRIALVQVPHAHYDRRWWRVDLSTPQLCVAGFTVAVALAAAAGAYLL